MNAVWEAALAWSRAGCGAVVARVVDSSSGRPRASGTALAVSESGQVVGSISGGCVDGDICARAHAVIHGGGPEELRYDGAEGDLSSPGLPCGGWLDVFIEPLDKSLRAVLAPLLAAIRRGYPVTLATVLSGAEHAVRHTLIPAHAGDTIPAADASLDRVRALADTSTTRILDIPGTDTARDLRVFVHSFPAPPRMLVFGADDFAAALTRIGRFLGYRVTLCDARPAFATASRFPAAHEVVVRWPHEYLAATPVTESTVICVLTHDAKFDVPLLAAALRSEAGYVGAMGSRRTHADRVRRLREVGVTEAELGRLAAPTGLDLGADTPEETAVSIAAEIVAQRRNGSGARLRDLDMPIHRTGAAAESARCAALRFGT
ncbi:XdhC family protein [Nocardia carnea]|uniref:XdhC family protein n=1 Tax=Nocardia carnea TaxID=37328 RepID=UPI002458DAFC|nr:XdhC family protein [Nocardia carnea]